MDKRRANHFGKPSAWSVISFILGLCALTATSLAAILWNPIDEDIINRADAAGWDTSMLLPHQTELSLLINASVLATFIMVVTAFMGMLTSRRRTGVSGTANLPASV